MKLSSFAFAKINISLDIVSKRDDGYHNLKTIMQSINLCDEISLECTNGEGINVSTNLAYIPKGDQNIAAKAAASFFAHTGITGYGADICIEKNIPVCAGLGGGSTDAACVLRMLDEMFETKLQRKALEEIGNTIGADVPFCISGGTKLAEGTGEILTDLPPIPQSFIVVCKPPFSCSTPELFGRVNCEKIRARPDTEGLIKALENADINGVARRMYNVFEDILPHGKSEVDAIKGILLDNDALGTVMTGSGPAVFGLFSGEEKAKKAYERLLESYKDCYLTKTV
ncbi:MAG: 4-(cytidine 5'-diphospho)-2-C-methyl-D-erythritol kinase [Oscillospiraceae bacterium]|nr:4-(cytidine 5'-diphospho)-2-C-methyl-D-erythritol kinase [Oscillospiraceae bacterium]